MVQGAGSPHLFPRSGCGVSPQAAFPISFPCAVFHWFTPHQEAFLSSLSKCRYFPTSYLSTNNLRNPTILVLPQHFKTSARGYK